MMSAARFEYAKTRFFVRRRISRTGAGILISYRAKMIPMMIPAAIRTMPVMSGTMENPYITAMRAQA